MVHCVYSQQLLTQMFRQACLGIHSDSQSMASSIVLSTVLVLTGSVHSLRDPTLPHIFFPFGADVGDEVVPVADEGSSPGLRISDGFPFFNVSRNTAYVSCRRCFFSVL